MASNAEMFRWITGHGTAEQAEYARVLYEQAKGEWHTGAQMVAVQAELEKLYDEVD